jgi:hypothetical protein
MPKKEVDRIKEITEKGKMPSTDNVGLIPRSLQSLNATSVLRNQPDQRSTDVIVFSKESFVKVKSGCGWESAGVQRTLKIGLSHASINTMRESNYQ